LCDRLFSYFSGRVAQRSSLITIIGGRANEEGVPISIGHGDAGTWLRSNDDRWYKFEQRALSQQNLIDIFIDLSAIGLSDVAFNLLS